MIIQSALYPYSGTGENVTVAFFRFNPYTGQQFNGKYEHLSSTDYNAVVVNSNAFGYPVSNFINNSAPVFTSLDQALFYASKNPIATIVLWAPEGATFDNPEIYKCIVNVNGFNANIRLSQNNTSNVLLIGQIAARGNSKVTIPFSLCIAPVKYPGTANDYLLYCHDSQFLARGFIPRGGFTRNSVDIGINVSGVVDMRFSGYYPNDFTIENFVNAGSGGYGGVGIKFKPKEDVLP